VRQGSGTYFRGPDQQLLFRLFEWSLLLGEVRDLLETRADLEVLALRAAAERRSEDDVAALQELLERMRTSDREHFADAAVAFHARSPSWPATSPSMRPSPSATPSGTGEDGDAHAGSHPATASLTHRRREQATCDVNQPP
jgi:FCD domain